MWKAVKSRYRLACVFDGMEIWLPRQQATELLPGLSSMGCSGVGKPGRDPAASPLDSRGP
jgi:hypothetical protein